MTPRRKRLALACTAVVVAGAITIGHGQQDDSGDTFASDAVTSDAVSNQSSPDDHTCAEEVYVVVRILSRDGTSVIDDSPLTSAVKTDPSAVYTAAQEAYDQVSADLDNGAGSQAFVNDAQNACANHGFPVLDREAVAALINFLGNDVTGGATTDASLLGDITRFSD